MADLTTLDAVRQQLGLGPVDTDDDELITDYVTEASIIFQNEVNLPNFSAANGTLLLNACPPHAYGRQLFFRDYVVGVYSVVNGDGLTVDPAHYRLLPYNSSPKYGMELTIDSGLRWTFDRDPHAAITVAGTLGYCTSANVPADVTLAVTKLAVWLYQNRDNRGETIKFADGSKSIPAEAPAIVLRTQKRYIRDVLYA